MRISDTAAMSGVSRQTAHKRLVRPARRADDRQGLPPASYEGLGVVVECVMTDNGPAYRSGEFNALLEARGMGHKYTRPFSPWQNGKVERMNRTIAREWQHARVWESKGGQDLRFAPLHRLLQLGPSAQRVRRLASDVTHSRCKQCLGT